ncbi:MAG: hypothetical protein AAF602_05675 [Myxococcota bacterium]
MWPTWGLTGGMQQSSRWWGALAAIVVPLGALMVGVRRVYPFVADDALISYRYAERWLAGRGLTWDDHDAVEGYSNLAWIVATAGLGALGVDLIVAGRVLGILCTIGVFAALLRFATREGGSPLGALVASTLLALLGTIYVWAIGGLETPLVAMTLAIGWTLVDALMADHPDAPGARGRPWALGAVWAALVLSRPDGPLFVAIGGLALLWHHRGLGLRAVRWGAPAVVLPLVAWLGQLVFRVVYYQDWLPNPAHMKADVTWRRLRQGADYIGEMGLGYLPLIGVALVALVGWRSPRVRSTGVVIGVSGLTWAAYVASVGGDIFPGHRHGVPIAVGLGFLVVLGYEAVGRWRRGRLVLVGASVLAAGLLAWGQPRMRANERAVTERWEWDSAVTGGFLREAFAEEQPVVAVTAAGAIPYFSRLPALDLFGLNDRHIASTPSQGGRIGHDRGDGDYVLERAPDLLVFGMVGQYRPPPTYRQTLTRDSRLYSDYVRIRVRGREPWPVTAGMWARRDGRVGIQRTPDRFVVPGYFVPGTRAELAQDGTVVGRFPSHGRAGALELEIPAGSWRAWWPPEVGVVRSGAPGRVDGRTTTVVGPATVEVTVTPILGTAILPIRFERVPNADVSEDVVSLSPAASVGPPEAEVPFRADTRGQPGAVEAWSEPFVVPDDGVLAFALGGPSDERRIGLRVWHAGRPVLAFVPDRKRIWQERLIGLEGEEVRLQLVDEDPRPQRGVRVGRVQLHRMVSNRPSEE